MSPSEIREWIVFLIDAGILGILIAEYKYDFNKDEAKKQRRTKTTKKTTSKAGGESIIEESVEVSEPVQENKNGRDEQKV